LGEDGFLTALEIADLDIPARLVVLSGCSTGAGVLFRGEGIKGMSGAFLGAGADYVLVSLWNADDRTTAVFMENFYGFLAKGDPPARASARAKLDLIRSGLRNPFYWAPFVLIGHAGDGD
jgi:CHAT domain-containing protein